MIDTDRLYIRPVTTDDAAFIYTLMNSKGWIENIGDRQIHSIAIAEDYIRDKMLEQHRKMGYGNNIVFLKNTNQAIGAVGIYNRPGLEYADIGFAFLDEYHGKGYALESARPILQQGFERHNLQTVQGITVKENMPSQKLLEKLGLHYKEMIKLPDDDIPLKLYEIQNPNWQEIDYNGKIFKPISSVQNSETTEETIFYYYQKDQVLTSEYRGGKILHGHLLGIVDKQGNIDMRYHQINNKGELRTGRCSSRPEIMENGKIRLFETWEWTSGDYSNGTSILEEQ